MTRNNALQTTWMDALARAETPCRASLREHLLEVHRLHPGFTEGCATKCKDAQGRVSYEWLCDVVDPARHRRILDLACGSGFLLALCRDRFPTAELIGVDMSPAELALAETRLTGKDVALREGLAQDLSFAEPQSVDALLCHWALTLMDPIEPVLREIERVMARGGVFAAVVDGDPATAPGYTTINDLVFKHVRQELPTYGDERIGDPRTRIPEQLAALASGVFRDADVTKENAVFALEGPSDALATQAVDFFYAAFVLPPASRARLLAEVEAFLDDNAVEGVARFSMPVCRLNVVF